MTEISRAELEERHLTLSNAVLAEIEAARARGELGPVVRRETCYVCCETESNDLVNRLLAIGMTNREIVERCAGINGRREDAEDRRLITARSVYYHRTNHFNIDKPVNDAYRKIVERRAAEANLDFINGVDNIVTGYAVIETIMTKGFAAVIGDETKVTVKEAMEAAGRLHDMTSKDASNRKMADMIYALDRMVRAAQEFIPEELYDAFLAKAEGRPIPITAEVVEPPQTVREFIPTRHADEDEFI